MGGKNHLHHGFHRCLVPVRRLFFMEMGRNDIVRKCVICKKTGDK